MEIFRPKRNIKFKKGLDWTVADLYTGTSYSLMEIFEVLDDIGATNRIVWLNLGHKVQKVQFTNTFHTIYSDWILNA
jgi:hypothetical protein